MLEAFTDGDGDNDVENVHAEDGGLGQKEEGVMRSREGCRVGTESWSDSLLPFVFGAAFVENRESV